MHTALDPKSEYIIYVNLKPALINVLDTWGQCNNNFDILILHKVDMLNVLELEKSGLLAHAVEST